MDDFNLDIIKLFPNPFTNKISINLPSGFNNQNFKIELFDINGRPILRRNLKSINGEIKINHLENIQQGMYFIKIFTDRSEMRVIKSVIKF